MGAIVGDAGSIPERKWVSLDQHYWDFPVAVARIVFFERLARANLKHVIMRGP